MIFYSTKRNTELGATKLAQHVKSRLSREDVAELEGISSQVLNVLDRPTEQCVKLSRLVEQRGRVPPLWTAKPAALANRECIQGNRIKAICSTTTLGFGVNMPAHTVLIRDTTRYEGGYSERLGINEITQLFGRAGRPKYDKEGRALLLASNNGESKGAFKVHRIKARSDRLSPWRGSGAKDAHTLVYSRELPERGKAMQRFMAKSFYSHQYGNQRHINNIIDEILLELEEWEFVESNNHEYRATKLGKRVSELYIDPLSAKWIVDSLSTSWTP